MTKIALAVFEQLRRAQAEAGPGATITIQLNTDPRVPGLKLDIKRPGYTVATENQEKARVAHKWLVLVVDHHDLLLMKTDLDVYLQELTTKYREGGGHEAPVEP